MSGSVSLCLIARNEEANLATCLESVADLVQEIIVVDTGSTDATRQVAARFGARVFDFAWVDSFAAARNESLRHATGGWIFWLDADDRIDPTNRQRLRHILQRLGDQDVAYLMTYLSVGATDPHSGSVIHHPRLFRSDTALRWEYRVHEQILPALLRRGTALAWTDVVIHHSGYQDPELRRRKEERNLRLLRMQDAERPNDPVVLFHLARCLHALERSAEAWPVLERCLQRADPQDAISRKLYAVMAHVQRRLGNRQQALAACLQGRQRFPDDAELLFMEAGLRFFGGDLAGAEAAYLRLLNTPPPRDLAMAVDPTLRGPKGRYNLGIVYRDQGRLAEAEAQWRAVLAEQPGNLEAWMALGDLWLAQKRWPEVERAVQELQRDPQRQVEAALLQARLLMARQEFAAARRLLEQAVADNPRVLPLRMALSHVLVQEGTDRPAAEQALRAVLELDPDNQQARDHLQALARQPGQVAPADEAPAQPLRTAAEAEECFQRAEKAFKAERYDEAAVLYRQLLEARVTPGLMLFRLGMIADQKQDYASAWDLHGEAIRVDPALPAKVTPRDSVHHHTVLRPQYAVEEVPHCPVCGSDGQKPLRVLSCLLSATYQAALHPVRRWVKCLECGHAFANPRPAAAAREEAAQAPPPADPHAWDHEQVTADADIIHTVWERHSGRDLLVVAVGHGRLAGVAQDFGYRVWGLDRHPASRAAAERLGITFGLGELANLDFGNRRFDVITLGGVLDREPAPRALMTRAVALLKPGGLIWLSTADHEGTWARVQGERDSAWGEGDRVQYFGRRSLACLLEGQGLRVSDYRFSKRRPGCVEVIAERSGRAGKESGERRA
jgi:tetratricopeptide (TPR) repeat protein/SAM-dependent methyltransferase